MIPERLKPYRFVKIKTKEKKPYEFRWQLDRNYNYDEIGAWLSSTSENYGVKNGVLRILDDDTQSQDLIKLFLEQFGKTFRVRDHLYFEFTNQNKKLIKFYNKEGKHSGELQGEGQQCVGPGSIHPSGEIYDLRNDIDIIKIDYDKFCEVFKDWVPNLIKNVVKDFKKTTWTGDSVTDIPITNIISLSGLTDSGHSCYQGPHPQHGSANGMNFRVDTNSNSWFCYRCWTGGGPSELIGVMEGIIDCSAAGSNCYSPEQGKEVIEIAREKYGLVKPETQKTFQPMGWALSINIKTMAERNGWLNCPQCNNAFEFNQRLGWFKCKCSKGGIKKFVEMHPIKIK